MALRMYARTLGRRTAWVTAILLLTLVLAFSACAGRGAGNGRVTYGPGASGATPIQQNDAAAAVIQADSGLDSITSAMDSASQDANADLSSQDNESSAP